MTSRRTRSVGIIPARIVAAATAGSALAFAPSVLAVDGVPLPTRDGVVIAWQAGSNTALVVTDDHRAYAVHALRRVAPGTRVRVDGVKWGSPTSGIKWSTVPSGVKWGIKWGIKRAANGSYQSRLTPLRAKARSTSLRGTVVRRFGGRGVAVSVPGSTVVVPLRGAVWLPGGKRSKAYQGVGRLGARVRITIAFDAAGRPFGRRVVETAPPGATPTAPVSGRVVAVDLANRTLTLTAGTKAFPLAVTVNVPAAVDILRFPVDAQVAAVVVQTTPGAPLAGASLSLNGTFAEADTPSATPVAAAPAAPALPDAPMSGVNPIGPSDPGATPVPPSPTAPDVASELRTAWVDAHAQGLIPNTGLYESQQLRLERVASLIGTGDGATATAELLEFELRLATTPDGTIDAAFRDTIAAKSTALRALLA